MYQGSRDITSQADGENTLAGPPPHSDPERELSPQARGTAERSSCQGRVAKGNHGSEPLLQRAVEGVVTDAAHAAAR